ncbi:MAG: UDP-N-acetylmuramate--L-alanine ligase [Myxococcota bacterium]
MGVGGAGMSALARLLQGIGADVTGSDSTGGSVIELLRSEGLPVWTGHQPERVHGENGYVVRSAAVPAADPEVQEAERRGFTVLIYAEAVGRLSEGKRTLAVAGSHGKTTTTALTVAALRGAGMDPSHLIGGEVPELGGNGCAGNGEELVVEACEFNRSFHNLRPAAAAILNVDHDHFDCYPSRDDLIEAYAGYLAKVGTDGTAFVDEFVPEAVLEGLRKDVRLLRVGSGLFADLRAVDLDDDLGRYTFVPIVEGRRLPRVHLSLSGRFQVHNALFALGLALAAGADPEGACRGVSRFSGVLRRFELRKGSAGGFLINDYAHHPAEIRAVIHTARKRFPGRRILVAFQPHQFRRTLALLPEFAEVLSDADQCLIADIYGARESLEIRSRVSAEDLVRAIRELGGCSERGGTVQELPDRVRAMYGSNDLVLVLGAGDIDQAVDEIAEII